MTEEQNDALILCLQLIERIVTNENPTTDLATPEEILELQNFIYDLKNPPCKCGHCR